jgi:hypothetical protein
MLRRPPWSTLALRGTTHLSLVHTDSWCTHGRSTILDRCALARGSVQQSDQHICLSKPLMALLAACILHSAVFAPTLHPFGPSLGHASPMSTFRLRPRTPARTLRCRGTRCSKLLHTGKFHINIFSHSGVRRLHAQHHTCSALLETLSHCSKSVPNLTSRKYRVCKSYKMG